MLLRLMGLTDGRTKAFGLCADSTTRRKQGVYFQMFWICFK